jgi:hypothetical protein
MERRTSLSDEADPMSIPFPNKESRKYFFLWIILVAVGCSLWFLELDNIVEIGSYTFIVIFGLGIVSGLNPVKAFQACFFGLLTVFIHQILSRKNKSGKEISNKGNPMNIIDKKNFHQNQIILMYILSQLFS